MTNDIPTLDLPTFATQDGGTIKVETLDQALQVLEFIPEELDPLFSIVITDVIQNIVTAKILNSLGKM